jgi:hypothetical protein
MSQVKFLRIIFSLFVFVLATYGHLPLANAQGNSEVDLYNMNSVKLLLACMSGPDRAGRAEACRIFLIRFPNDQNAHVAKGLFDSNSGKWPTTASNQNPSRDANTIPNISNNSTINPGRNNLDDEKAALTKSCASESSAILRRGNEEAKAIMSRSNDTRSGFLVMINSLTANMKMYQGRCSGASDSTGNIAQSAKLLLQISQSCAAAGFGSDCDEMRKTAQASTTNNYSSGTNGGTSGGGSNPSQRIYSDDPSKAYIPPNQPGQRVYSDQPNSTSTNSTGGETRIVWDGGLTNCVIFKSRPRKSDDSTQWYEMTNSCNTPINVWSDPNGRGRYGKNNQ